MTPPDATYSTINLGSLLSLCEVGEVLGVSLRTARRYAEAGAFPLVRLSKRSVRVRPEDLARFIDERLGPASRKSSPASEP
jgi:predicted site-specific integrase-resolvase